MTEPDAVREAWREDMAELAMHCRAYRDGDWSLDDWLEWSPVGRGEAAAFERGDYLPPVRSAYMMGGAL